MYCNCHYPFYYCPHIPEGKCRHCFGFNPQGFKTLKRKRT